MPTRSSKIRPRLERPCPQPPIGRPRAAPRGPLARVTNHTRTVDQHPVLRRCRSHLQVFSSSLPQQLWPLPNELSRLTSVSDNIRGRENAEAGDRLPPPRWSFSDCPCPVSLKPQLATKKVVSGVSCPSFGRLGITSAAWRGVCSLKVYPCPMRG